MSTEHGIKVTKYRLECQHHWWNFDSREKAIEAAPVLVDCKDHNITEVVEYINDDGEKVDKEKRTVQ